MQSKVVNDVPATGTPHSRASTTRAAASRPQRGLRAASARSRRDLPEKSEDNLTSPPQLTTLDDVWRGVSPFQKLDDVRNGDRPDTVRAPRPYGGKDVAVAYVRKTLDSTG